MKKFYFDYAATSSLSEYVKKTVISTLEMTGNPSSVHFEGVRAARELETARAVTAKALDCGQNELYFTSGGTEANNAAINGILSKTRKRRIIMTESEHPSVYEAVAAAVKRGFEVVKIGCRNGIVDLQQLENSLNAETALVCVMTANNETGALYDLAAVYDIIKKADRSILLHTDAVQAFGKLPAASRNMITKYSDTAAVSGHKLGSLGGIGALYIKKGLFLPPMITGGGQERGFRSGTENMAGIISLRAVCEEYLNDDKYAARCEIYKYAVEKIESLCHVNIPDNHLYSIISAVIENVKSEVAVNFLSNRMICVSAAAACSGKAKNNRVLEDFGLSKPDRESTVRISISHHTTREEIDYLCDALRDLRKI